MAKKKKPVNHDLMKVELNTAVIGLQRISEGLAKGRAVADKQVVLSHDGLVQVLAGASILTECIANIAKEMERTE